MKSKNAQKSSLHKKINVLKFRRALGATSVSSAKASVWKEAPKPMRRLILHGIYSEFARSSKIGKNMEKLDFMISSVSCR